MLVLWGSERQGFVLLCFIASVCLQLLLAVSACLAAPGWNSSCRGEGPFSPRESWLLDPTHPWATFQAPVQWTMSTEVLFSTPRREQGSRSHWLLPGCVQCLNAAPLLPGISNAPLQLDQFFAQVWKLHIIFWDFSFFLQDWIIGNKVGCKSLH